MTRMKKKIADIASERIQNNERITEALKPESVAKCAPVDTFTLPPGPVDMQKLMAEVLEIQKQQQFELVQLKQQQFNTTPQKGLMVLTPPVKQMPKEAFLPNEYGQYNRRAHEEVAAHQQRGHLLAMDMPFEVSYLIIRLLQTVTNHEERSPVELLDTILSEIVNLKAKRTVYDPLNTSTRVTNTLIESEKIYQDVSHSATLSTMPDPLTRRIKATYQDDLVTQIHGLVYRALRNMVFQFSTHETVGLPEEYVLISYTPEKLFWFLPFEAYQG